MSNEGECGPLFFFSFAHIASVWHLQFPSFKLIQHQCPSQLASQKENLTLDGIQGFQTTLEGKASLLSLDKEEHGVLIEKTITF